MAWPMNMFDKYHRLGAYHWDWFRDYPRYRAHALRVWSWISESRETVLDVGAGDGLITYLLGCRGIEINCLAVRLARERGADVRHADLYTYDYPPDLEAIFLGDVLEHLRDPAGALGILRTAAAKLYLTTPPANGQDHYDHWQEWTPQTLVEFCARCGWAPGSPEMTNGEIYLKLQRERKMANGSSVRSTSTLRTAPDGNNVGA